MEDKKTPEEKLLDLIRRKKKDPKSPEKDPGTKQSRRNMMLQGQKVAAVVDGLQEYLSFIKINPFKDPQKARDIAFDLGNKLMIVVSIALLVILVIQFIFPYSARTKAIIEAPIRVKKPIPLKKETFKEKAVAFDLGDKNIFRKYEATTAETKRVFAGGTISGFSLVGIVYGDKPRAILRSERKKSGSVTRRIPPGSKSNIEPEVDHIVKEGDIIENILVIEIKRKEVILERDGKEYKLSL